MKARTHVLITTSFLAGSALTAAFSSAQTQYRSVTSTPVAAIDLGDWCEGKEVTVDVERYGPGLSGRHYHAAYSFAWMLQVSQIKLVEGRSPIRANGGDLVTEAPMEVNESRTEAPAQALVFRIRQKGQPPLTRVP